MVNESLLVTDYVESYRARGMTLDEFQVEACRSLARSRDVLVSAPTGSGKTVVAHFAVYLALASERRCVYTAPIKALSNQKFTELRELIGEDNVGLLTGDQTINRDAQIIVVTTEVLRNMLLHADPEIENFGYAVLDEVHYLSDRDRGPVWEETILSLPEHVRLVSLSATIANTDELASWMRSVRGPTDLIVSHTRPVPLEQSVALGKKFFPLYDDAAGSAPRPHPSLVNALRQREDEPPRRMGDKDRRRIIGQLANREMLPAIEFIFSRKGCDRAVDALLRREVVLTTDAERAQIREEIARLRDSMDDSNRRAVGFERAAQALERGYGAHHAGVYPPLKELTEKLMEHGLLRIVYATGTLALGIDMPVRTVVLEELTRWNGTSFVDLTATEYTQLIGRAGRRGKDAVGYGVVMGNSQTDAEYLAELGSGKVEPLLSAFQPSYNTVINLLSDRSYRSARDVMNRSFAQYQRNADLGNVTARLERVRRRIGAEEARLQCDRGNVVEYIRLRASGGRGRKSARKQAKREYREHIAQSFANLRTGSVYAYAAGRELFYGMVTSADRHRARVVDWNGDMYWLYEDELASEMRRLGEAEVPFGMSLKKADVRDQVADSILDVVAERADLGLDRDLLESWARFAPPRDEKVLEHPCASCPDIAQHVREGQELLALDRSERELAGIAESYEDSVGREFDATADVLLELGILQVEDADSQTPGGREVRLGRGANQLREIHTETDLLLYTCLASLPEGALTSAQLAGWTSMFLNDDRLGSAYPRSRELFELARAARGEADFLRSVEAKHGIDRTPDVTPGCVDVFAQWAGGANLETCLEASRLSAGDFIGAARRLIDILGQIVVATEGTWISDLAHQARDAVRRRELVS